MLVQNPVIKGELHTSRGDLREERNLLAEGVDTLVIEGQEGESDLGWLHGWFGIAMLIFEHLFARFVYTDHQTLVDIAKGQNADVIYTRESDADILSNSHRIVVGIAFVMFYGLICTSVFVGLLVDEATGAGILLLAGLGPLLLLRTHETVKSDGNRDQIIAGLVEDAATDGGRVVAVMGQKHAENVPSYLPDEMDPIVRKPKYGFLSAGTVRDLAFPSVQLVATLGMIYPAFLFVANLYLAYAG